MNRISRLGQARIYFGKCLRLFVNEKQWKNFISALIIVLIISFVTSDEMFRDFRDTKNGAFAIICACIWIGLFNSIQSVCRERPIIKHEHRTGLHISSYILAHVWYEAILCLVQSLIVFVVVLLKNASHLPVKGVVMGMPLDLLFTLFLVTFTSDMIALLISCIVKTETSAMTVMPFVLIIQLVMSGAVFVLEGAASFIANFTISKWGLNAILSLANTHSRVQTGYDAWVAQGLTEEGITAEPSTMLGCWGMLLLFCIIYIALAVIFLKQVDRDQR
ncbi:MAG: ABC transporter permease [Firmicutes bacterium]|nr:ABC transporter permease [Bacillota bacterium]